MTLWRDLRRYGFSPMVLVAWILSPILMPIARRLVRRESKKMEKGQ